MNVRTQRPLGATGLNVTGLCLGCGVLGGMPEVFGYDVAADQGVATVRRALEGPLTFLDTSAGYAGGNSEDRVGQALRERGGIPEGVVVATKVDPEPGSSDLSGAQVRISAERSLERLGLDQFQLLYLHDPERIGYAAATASGGPVEALTQLHQEGIAAHIGVAGGPVELLLQLLDTAPFEVVLTHNRYTLLDRSAEPLLEAANRAGVGVVNAAPFGGGILVRGTESSAYAYRPASTELLNAVEGMQYACATYDVSLGAAALQFSTCDPRIASTVVGLSAPERIEQALQLADEPIPDELWPQLEAFVPDRQGWLD